MTRFNVPEMSCGHCTAAIEKAIKEIDLNATIACNLNDRTVTISSDLPAKALQSAIYEAGYKSEAA
ncbi:heavy-metal-associated domain-containing protein [Tropicimonas sp. IMCC6043]|uniref:heavy-metal-associated domain-containing protein n=1 Tax=Tropicimonas sp. IMCC6043 TaxID=2510645 RepID=UPI00101CD5BC|nr:heavy-metal-associated domain-containing protein [Tropicimonas sp. IMCC6043]RYH06000.1 copper chaperone [Tropicimonas sp. IMCC6043]